MKWLIDREARKRAEVRDREARPKQAPFSERGVAVIAVSVAIVMIATMSVEFGTNTNIDTIAAANARDNVRTHFLARSGMNLTQMMIRFQTDILDKNEFTKGVQFADYAPMFMALFGGSPEEVQGYSALLGAAQGETIKGLGVSAGEFTVEITTEDAKINVNCATGNDQKTLKAKIDSLIYFEAFDPLFAEPAADGWQRTRDEQATAIVDYIDPSNGRYGAPGASEDYGYESQSDKYKSKDYDIDTVLELRQVRGVDDRFWTLFGDQFTAYGDCQVNLSAVRDVKLIAAIISLSAQNDDDPVVRDPIKLWRLATVVSEAASFGLPFNELKDFRDFVRNPLEAIGGMVGLGGDDAAQAAGAAGLGGALDNLADVEGVQLSDDKLKQVARTGARRTYRAEVTAHVGPKSRRFVKRMIGIWDAKTTNQNPRNPADTEGTWVYWKEE